MPLTRYQLRNEYGLASPDLYRTADKDDSETLLEAVAMAGLVGVLRQLGDLAEFAAEIFHDLHEEVMATAARGHALVVRAHQLEADVPAIEKAFLSQNSHPSFFTNAGINWHPILHTDQNLITRGDLPRCVMDSYEECWGPPRLFLLDKFDVAGAGASLKRYTDPSFFKNETASSELKSLDVQMENNMRKAKKKGPRLKNGESPQNISTSHAKLHQLFMEERLGNNFSDPDRLVKLKKRQLNGSPLDFKSGKSYMEKFLQTPSPEHKAVYETSVDPPLLKLTSDNSSESGMETVDIGVVSPVKRSSEIIESICPSPNSPEVALMPNMQELNSEISTLETAKEPVLSPAVDTSRIRPILARVIAKNGLLVDGEQNHKSNLYVDTPVHITGEVENYLDALAAMETDSESENEHSIKSDLGVFGGGKCGTDSDANNGQVDIEGLSSDSQLLAVSTVFDYGSSTSMRYMLSGFSCSDKISNTADNVPTNTEETAEAFTSTTNFASKDETYSIQLPTHTDIQGSSSAGLVHANDAIVNESLGASPGEYELEEALSDSDTPDSELFSTDGIGFSRSISFEVAPVDHSQTDIVCTDSPLVDELHGGDEAISCDAMMHLSKNLEPDPEHKSRCNYLDQLHQTDSIEENAEENSAPLAMISLESTIMPLKQQSDSVQSDTGVNSDNGLLPDMIEVLRPGNSAPAADVVSNVMVNSDCAMPLMESLHCRCTNERLSKTVHDVPNVGQNLDDISESNLAKVSEPAAGKQIRELSHKAYENGSAAVKLDKKANSLDVSDLKGHIGKADPPTKAVFSAHVAASTACDTTFHDDYDNIGYVPSNLIVPPCRPPMISEEHHSASKIPYEQAQKFTKRIYPESSILSQAKRDQGKAVDSDSMVSKPGSCNYSHKEDVAKKSILTKPMDTPILGEFTFSPLSLVVDLDLESKLLCSTHLPGTKHDVPAPPNLNSETHSEHLLELPSNQIQGESPPGDDACSDSSSLLSGRAQPRMDQEVCFALHELSPGDLPGQHPIPSVDVSAQSVDQEIDQVKHRLSSRPSDFGLVHDATHLRIVEMPPLPPLPPMQWRMGKAQLDFHSQTELVGHTEESFPLRSEYRADRKSQLDFPAPEIQRGESRNMYPPLEAVEKKQHHVSDKSADSLVQPTAFVVDISGMANATSILCPGTSFENLQSSPSSVIEAISNKRQEYGSPEKDNDREGSGKPFAGMPRLEQTVSGHDLMSSLDNQAEPSDAYMVDTDREGNICQAILPECGLQAENSIGMSVTRTANGQEQPSNNKEKQPPDDIKGQPPVNAEVQHPIEAVEHPLQDLTTLGGEMRLASIPSIQHCLPISEAVPLSRLKAPSLSAIRKANVNPAIENPRPGDPLINAVAALDKSRLRKVSKLGRPQVGPRLDERDSLLEQIRTKSFNLRSAGGTRPSIQRIQGPKTNLRIAAILEKANSIRQATVGSDEEGDDDNWSDS